MKKNAHIIVVGAGLCGTLLAIRMAQRGFKVSLYEMRPDMRTVDISAGRSINLALSDRGLKALRLIGMESEVRKQCIPMYGRMIHPLGGEPRMSKYSGRPKDYINSVSRGGLNIALLNRAEELPNIELHFNAKCTQIDLKNARAFFTNKVSGKQIEVQGDAVIGTDGAGSAVRRSMMGHTTELLFNYSQDFLRHGYKELNIPATPKGGFRIENNALHIWPRGNYMVIALPNLDGSFTVTMFHPFDGEYGFNALDSRDKVIDFFNSQFPDLVKHMPTLINDYFSNPTGALGTIKCFPWQAYGKTLLMGDAAHAIVPFYGQGMNASFEDVTVFDEVLNSSGDNWTEVFEVFQNERKKDTDAIADLAIDNFFEMRDHVSNPDFIKKRQLEMKLEQAFPEYYSKYSLVTFKEDLPYAAAMRQGRKQDRILLELCRTHDVDNMELSQVMDRLKEMATA